MRRNFAALVISAALIIECPWGMASPSPGVGGRGPWKVEITLYDNPNASSIGVADCTLLADDTIIVPISVTWRGRFHGYDWYSPKDTMNLNLVSRDRGLSWQVWDKPIPPRAFHLRDRSWLRIRWLGYQPHPMSELPQWERAGYWVYMVPEKQAFSTTGGFVVERSRDQGKTWQSAEIKLPHRAFLAGYGMTTARMLSDGTILMPAFGYQTRRHKTYSCSVIRSTDSGKTWQLITVARDERPQAVAESDLPSGSIWAKFPEARGFDEASLVETRRPGRVVAVIEESQSKELFTCVSDDRGETWSKPRSTGMFGVTPFLLRLKSGALACAFTNRYHGSENERGMWVCYSHDDGETWDAAHPAILRDYNARADSQCLWNFVQFSDRTLFASGWALKTGCGGGNEISYAVGFRFTEDFRTPLRVVAPPKP